MPQKSDAELRKDRLRFYREEMSEINATLRGFLQRAKANAAFLVDKDGHLITKEGADDRIDIDSICGLVAGAFAATKQVAVILGEETFLNLFHQGKKANIQVTLVGNRTILAVVFDDTTTIGMVRLYLAEAAKALTEIFQRILQRHQNAQAAV
ncbi:MAG: roadblock/LC7 domain-containing protein [Planctomycetota bacterium]|jgi:predicted regulator of Ras-like GTPase activity (Roadblock/LC7/MglB family)